MLDSLFSFDSLRSLSEQVSNFGVDPGSELVWLLVVAGVCTFYMGFGIGANDCANNFGSSWGSGALSLRACLCIAGVCEMAGAIFLGSNVTKTFRKGIATSSLYDGEDGRVLVIVGMTAVLFSAASWLMFCSRFGLPVSTTHSAVGGVIAFAIASKGFGSVQWDKVGLIVVSWFVSPVLSMLIAFCVFYIIKTQILCKPRAFYITAAVAPFITGVTAFVIAMFAMYKGAKGLGWHKTELGVALGISCGVAALLGGLSLPIANHIKKQLEEKEERRLRALKNAGPVTDVETVVLEAKGGRVVSTEEMLPVEQLWCGFCWITASFEALAHGGNDVANSVGPFAAVLAAMDDDISKKSEVPIWAFLIAGFGIVIGLFLYGKNVMETIGKNVTQLKPSMAFSAELSACFVILLATKLGIPISTTHASVGAVMGAGAAEYGWASLKWDVLVKVFASWIVTLPAVGILTMGIYAFLLPCAVSVPMA